MNILMRFKIRKFYETTDCKLDIRVIFHRCVWACVDRNLVLSQNPCPCKAHIEVVYFDREFSCELSDLFCIISDIVDKVYEDGVSPLSDDLEITIKIGEFNTADVAYNVDVIVVLIVSVFIKTNRRYS